MQKKCRVLIADDEFHIRLMIASLLKTMDCDVVGEAQNGEEAILLYRSTQPDLLLMDLNMPVKTGEIALKQIMTEFPEAKVIMLTSVADIQSVESCLSEGALHFIRKDCPIEEIKTTILDALTHQE